VSAVLWREVNYNIDKISEVIDMNILPERNRMPCSIILSFVMNFVAWLRGQFFIQVFNKRCAVLFIF